MTVSRPAPPLPPVVAAMADAPSLLVGLVSDTHGHAHPRLAEAFAGCDVLLHAGDVGAGPPGEAVLAVLEALAPTLAVFGNVDDARMRRHLPEWLDVPLGGVRFAMTHIGGRPERWAPGVKARLAADPPGVFVVGHSHILRVERVPTLGGMLFANPGAAGLQGFHETKTALRLHLAGGLVARAEAVHLDG